MKRKVLCSILAILIILASVPMTAFAADGEKTITDISLTATRDLIQYYDGWYNEEEVTPYFYYNVFDGARPDMFVTYSDGSSENVSYDNFHNHFWSTDVVTLQSVATEFGLGKNTAEIEIFYGNEGEKSIKTSMDFTIIENPVESFSVIANKDFIENISGSYEDKYDEEGNVSEQYFFYHYELADIEITVNYKNGESKKYTYSGNSETNIYDQTGYDLCFDGSQGNNTFVLGENVMAVSYMGVKSTVTFNVVPDPVEKITVVPTKTIQFEKDGWWTDCYESDGTYFDYDISATEPQITVEYNDGTPTKTCAWDECYSIFGEKPSYEYDQEKNPFSIGENSITVEFLGHKTTYIFEIVPNPIKSVSLDVRYKLEENKSGYMEEEYDDEDNFVGEYFYYDLDEEKTFVTVEYNDETKESVTFCLDDLGEYFEDSIEIDLGQSYENQLTVGVHTGTIIFNDVKGTFTFEIVPNPIKSVSLDVRYKLEENKSGYMEEEYDGEDNFVGEYFYYDLDEEKTFVTVEYNDETKESVTFCLDDLGEYFEDSIEIDLGQSYENPLAAGVHTGTVILNGVKGTFTFEIVSNLVKKVEVRATKDLVENQDGRVIGGDYGVTYFYYYPSNLQPEFTVTFTDGSVKVYSYYELDYCGYDYYIDLKQSGENPLKPGTHTGTASFNGIETTFTFKIVEEPIKNIVAVPTRDLVQYTDGYSTEGNDGEWYFWYDLYATQPVITINYKDGTSKTYTYEEIRRYTDIDLFITDNQDSDSQLKVGTNKTTVFLNNNECEYTFNVKKAEKTVTSISVVPEGKLIENIGGYFDCYEDGKEFYVYNNESLTYTVTIKYSDGTTKIQKGVEPFQKVDGSDFDIYFDCHDYENRFTVGKENKGVAYYKNATCTFPVEVVKNDYKAIEISGDNKFVVTLVKQDGTKVAYTANCFEIMGMGENELGVMLVTDKGKMELILNYNFNEEGTSLQNISAILGDEESGLKSNTLTSNKWLDMMIGVNNIGYIAPTYADGYSKHYYNRDFSGINGTITGDLVDDALTICTVEEYYLEYENYGVDEKGQFAILSLEEAKELLTRYFDPSKIDITTSPMYNAPVKEIKVYFIPSYEGVLSDEKLEYKNGKFVYTADWSSNYTDKVMPVTVVLANTGYVESISFTKGVCGTIKTISTEVVKNGVEITYSASENATEYEIYRSTNGGKYEKVGTSEKLNFVDTTAVSGKTYTYKVRGVNATNVGDFSGTKTVSYLAMPKTTATMSKAGYTIKWTKVDGAATYRIYRAEYSDGKWSNWNKLSDQKASVTAFADKNVKAGGVYKYTVRAMASGAASAYEGTPVLVYLTTPTVKIANAKGGIKGSWNAVAGAGGYIIYRSEYNSATKNWSNWINLGTTKATTKSFTDKTAVSGKTYRYTVRAVNDENMSFYTASNTLLYVAEPTVTIANAKAGITVKWTKSGGATGYIIYRSQYNASTKKWSSWTAMGPVNSTISSWTDKSVKSGVGYKYTVIAVNGKTMSTYTASASLARLTQPTVAIANAKAGVTVKWSKSVGATGYIICRASFVNGKWSSWENMGKVKNTVTVWTDKSAESGTTYRYTVRAVMGKSLSSYAGTAGLMFLSEPVVTISNASNGIKILWEVSEGASGYTIYRSQYNAKTKTWTKWVSRGNVPASMTSWTDKAVTSGVYYKYTVRAANGSYKSTYTSSAILLYLAQPTVTVAKAINSVVLKWTKTPGTKSYIVYRQEIKDGAVSNWAVLATINATGNSYKDNTAEAEKEYRYTVRAVNGSYKSAYKASNSVKL